MGHSFIVFIIVIGILVFCHEIGHFIVARLCNVGIEVFSLGFGPKIFKKKYGFTEYCISAIPLGGYVKMMEEEPENPAIDSGGRKLSITEKTLWEKSIIVAAGPFSNFLLAVLIFYILYQFSGLSLSRPVIGDVMENSPALSAGLRQGDVIREINMSPIDSFEDISRIIYLNKGRQLEILAERNGRTNRFVLFPELRKSRNVFEKEEERYIIGIVGTGEKFHKKLNPFQAMAYSVKDTYSLIKLTVVSFIKLISGSISADNIGGPLMIAQMAGEQARAGIMNLAWFIALLSVNLGIINLFPIPVLDGGHLLFFGIEALTGKAVSENLRQKMIQFGAAILVILMIFVFYNDILRMFNGG